MPQESRHIAEHDAEDPATQSSVDEHDTGFASMLMSMLGLCRSLPFNERMTSIIGNVFASLPEIESCNIDVPPSLNEEVLSGRQRTYLVRCEHEPVLALNVTFAEDTRANRMQPDILNALSILGTILENKNQIDGLNHTLSRAASQLKEANDTLAAQIKSHERLSNIVRKTSNSVVITGPDTKIIWVNHAFTKVSGYTLEECIGSSPGALLQCPETDPETIAYMHAQLAEHKGFRTTVLNQSKSGRKYWLYLDVHPILDDDGNVTEFIAVQSDVTELKLGWEAAQESIKLKRQFIATLNHEIRTPLNPVIALAEFIEVASDTLSKEKILEYVQDIGFAGRAMRQLIDGMLNFTRLEQDIRKITLQKVDICQQIGITTRLFEHAAKSRGQEIICDLSCEKPMIAWSETGALQQILGNLITNANKYTPEGGTITLRCRQAGPALVAIDVIDTGIGVPEEQCARIFEPFYRVKDAMLSGEQGVGIGLATVKLLANRLSAKLDFQSTLGAGTIVSLTLPTECPEDQEHNL